MGCIIVMIIFKKVKQCFLTLEEFGICVCLSCADIVLKKRKRLD